MRNVELKRLKWVSKDGERLAQQIDHLTRSAHCHQQRLEKTWQERMKMARAEVLAHCESRIAEVERQCQERVLKVEQDCAARLQAAKMFLSDSVRVPSAPLARKSDHRKLSALSL